MKYYTTKERPNQHRFFPCRYCVDNGAMIAQAGMLGLQYGSTEMVVKLQETECRQRYRTDQVEVVWRPKTRGKHA